MNIEEAVQLYHKKKEEIKRVRTVINNIYERNYFQRMPDEFMVYSKEFSEIAFYLSRYADILDNDLKQHFPINDNE